MIIAVDFDGCLASAGTWPEVGKPNEALINWLICLRKRGDKVILWTCRAIISQRRNSGGAYRLKFFGFEEDAEISINVFNYAVKVIRKRMATLRAIYRDAEREFGRNEKMAYVDGFCSGLYRNFEEQKKQSESFALALLVPEAVVKFVDEIPGMEEYNRREYQQKRENDVLRQAGYVDGKAFQNAGDKERLAYES